MILLLTLTLVISIHAARLRQLQMYYYAISHYTRDPRSSY